MQERTNRETRRRSRVVRVFPSVPSPGRPAGAVMCDQDEAWPDARCFSEKVMAAPCDEGRTTGVGSRPTEEQLEGFRLVAKRAIDASLGLADELEAA